MRKSLNQLRSEFQTLVEALQMPHSFYWGQWLDAYEDQTVQHPLVCVTLTNATMERDVVSVQVTITVSDKVYDGDLNEHDVESDTLRILRDIHQCLLSRRWRNFLTGQPEQTAQATRFYYRGGDITHGWFATYTMRIAANWDLCSIPIDPEYDFDQTFTPTCDAATLVVNETLTLQIGSGGTLDFSVVDENGDLTGSWDGEKWVVTGGGICLPATVELNGIEVANPASGATVDIPVIQDGNPVGSWNGTEWVVPACAPCADASWELENTAGTNLDSGTIASGDSENIIAPDGTVVNSDSSYTDTVASGGTLVLPDTTINITDQLGNPLDTITFPVYTPVNIDIDSYIPPCADATYNLEDTAGAPLASGNIPSGGSDTIVAPDGTVTITDTTPITLHTVAVKSNGVASQQISDSTVNVQKSDNTLINATTVKAEATTSYNVADSVVNVNAVKLADVKATDTLNITVVDSLDASVSVTLSGGNKITIPSLPCAPTPVGATLMRTGQLTSYRTGDDADTRAEGRATDFFTLASNNPFGNTNRFTDELGSSTYANNIVIDWSTYDGATVLGYRRTNNGANVTWNVAIDDSLLVSIGTFTTGWRLPNINELLSLFIFDSLRGLNYAPFNNNSNDIYWSSTTGHPSTSNAYSLANATKITANTAKGTLSGMRYIPCRTFTVTGTTLT